MFLSDPRQPEVELLNFRAVVFSTLGTLRSNYTVGNKNIKKTIGLISKTTTLHVHHAFLCIFCPFWHDYHVKIPRDII